MGKYNQDQRWRVRKWYLEGAGILSIERMEGVPNPLIIKWIRNFSKILREKLNATPIPEDAKDIEIVELDELLSYCKKTNKHYVWLAVDRVRSKVIDFEATQSRELRAYLPMAMRLKEKYNIATSCSDCYHVYGKYIIFKKHRMTKKTTTLVESFSSLIRHYLARFSRKTKRYSKAVDMICHSLLLLFNKNLLLIYY